MNYGQGLMETFTATFVKFVLLLILEMRCNQHDFALNLLLKLLLPINTTKVANSKNTIDMT